MKLADPRSTCTGKLQVKSPSIVICGTGSKTDAAGAKGTLPALALAPADDVTARLLRRAASFAQKMRQKAAVPASACYNAPDVIGRASGAFPIPKEERQRRFFAHDG